MERIGMHSLYRSFCGLVMGMVVLCAGVGVYGQNAASLAEDAADYFDYEKHLRVSFRPVVAVGYAGEAVMVQAIFENISPTQSSYRFRLWENSFEQWVFRVEERAVAMANFSGQAYRYPRSGVLPATLRYQEWQYQWRAQLVEPWTREIHLAYGESFSLPLRLDHFVNIRQAGILRIEAEFYPLSRTERGYKVPVEAMELEIRSSQDRLEEIFMPSERESGAAIEVLPPAAARQRGRAENPSPRSITTAKTPLSPAETVRRMLRAVQLKDWEKMLMHINLNEIMKQSYRSTEFFERMLTARPEERSVILSEFVLFLIESFDFDIKSFELLTTTETGAQAKSDVLLTSEEYYQRFKEVLNPLTGQLDLKWVGLTNDIPLTRSRIFSYELKPLNGVWKITALEVRLFDGDANALRAGYDLDQEEDAGQLTFEAVANILFAFNQAILNENNQALLSELVTFLNFRPSLSLRLLGFTDNLGTETYNRELSAKRVQVVRDFLSAGGIDPRRMEVFARGESDPLNFNQDDSERSLNRRVEIYLLP